MTRHPIKLRTLALFCLALPCMASAQATPDQAAWNGSLHEENYRGIRYVTGGVGAREQDRIKELAKDYDLSIVMTSESGAYLAGVELAFRNAQGQDVLLATSKGPFFLIDLPDGRYEVTARRPSAPIERRVVQIHGRTTQTLAFELAASS
jgi:hypothetical protein